MNLNTAASIDFPEPSLCLRDDRGRRW